MVNTIVLGDKETERTFLSSSVFKYPPWKPSETFSCSNRLRKLKPEPSQEDMPNHQTVLKHFNNSALALIARHLLCMYIETCQKIHGCWKYAIKNCKWTNKSPPKGHVELWSPWNKCNWLMMLIDHCKFTMFDHWQVVKWWNG